MANFNYVENTGIVIPDTENVQTDVQNEYRAVFGEDLLVDDSTPQGVLIAAETNARQSVVRNLADLANQFNPDVSGGIFLDAMVALLGAQRSASERSLVTAQLTGVANTTIPAGSLAATTGGDQFELVQAVQLDTNGDATAQFRAVVAGEIAIPAASLTTIVSSVLGWETINNSAAGTVGRLEESDDGLRRRRRNILALQGQTMPEAISSAVADVEGVNSLVFRENTTNATDTIDGQSLVAHSIYVCVDGGTDLDVATAILSRKSVGADFNGNTVVNVTDATTGQVYPVTFQRPTEVPVAIRVTIRSGSSLVDPVSAIRQTILDYAAGNIADEDGFVVGGDISPMEIAGVVGRENPRIFMTNVEVSLVTPLNFATSVLTIDIDEVATIVSSAIVVVVSP